MQAQNSHSVKFSLDRDHQPLDSELLLVFSLCSIGGSAELLTGIKGGGALEKYLGLKH
jgi:hypothetical protein